MFYIAKNNTIKLEQRDVDFISFGKGKNLIIILELEDGLKLLKIWLFQ